jgi:hypothetical protein
MEASPDGRDVFFVTANRLVAQDTDNERDLYDARLGGGIPAQNVAPLQGATAPCDGDGCQGVPGATPAPPVVASIAFGGAGNLVLSKGHSPAASTRPQVSLVQRLLRATAFTITVKVPGQGRITASGPGLRGVTKATTKAGTYRVRVSLTSSAKRTLKRKHTLRIRARVSYTPEAGQASVAFVTVKLAPPMPAKTSSKQASRRATVPSLATGKGR